jgi:peptidoglycan hydrolase-like protein with peptidoglycan-binding domain
MAQKKAVQKKGDPTKPKPEKKKEQLPVPKATRMDSMFLLNNNKYIQKMLDEGYKFQGKNDNMTKGSVEEFYDYFKNELKFNIEHDIKSGDRKGKFSDYYKEMGKFVGSSDWIMGGGDDKGMPFHYIHPHIRPQYATDMWHKSKPAVFTFGYDDLAIAPWDTLTPEQQKERIKKYGDPNAKATLESKPSTTKPSTKTSETKTSTTKPKPTIPKPIIEEVKKKAVSQYGKIKDGKRIATSEEEYNKNAAKGTKNTIIPTGFKLDPKLHELKKFSKGGSLSGPGDGKKGDPISKLKATLNPKNWGVTDYTDKGNFNAAFSSAKKAGEKEFMWNNKRFNTRKDIDPIKYTGNNPNQKEYDKLLRKEYPEFYKTLNKGQNVGEIAFERMNDEHTNRAFIQKKSKNSKISVGEEPDAREFIGGLIAEAAHLKDSKLNRELKSFFSPYVWKSIYESKVLGDEKMYDTPGTMEYNTHRLFEPGIAIMAHGNLSPDDIKRIQKYLGVKEDGYFGEITYKALQDKYKDNKQIQEVKSTHQLYTNDKDENPISMGDYPFLAKMYLNELNKEVPLKSYDKFENRLLRTPEYTDNALLNTSAENMNPLLLQEALNKRGYELPKSTKNYDPWEAPENRRFDGVMGEETRAALLDYQSKNKQQVKMKDKKNISTTESSTPEYTPHITPKFNLGGVLQGIAPMVNIAAQAYNWGTQDLNNLEYNIPQMTQDRNPYMSHGGTMPGSKSFDGATHEEGGIPVDANGQKSNNPVAEVEHDEFMHKFSFIPNKGNYIFSKKLGTADIAEGIVDKYTKMKGYKNPNKDPLMKAAMEFELKNIADLNDTRKAFEEQAAQAEQGADQGLEQSVMRLGGILKKVGLSKYQNGGPINSNKPLTEEEIKWISKSVRGTDSSEKFSGKFPDNTIRGGSTDRIKNLTPEQTEQVKAYMQSTGTLTDILEGITPNIPMFNPKPKTSKLSMGGPMDDPNADPLAKGLNQSLRGRMPELPNLNSGIIPPVSTGAKPLILPQEYSGYTADPGIVGEGTKTNPNLMDSGLSGALRSAVMVGDAFSAMRKAEKESPVMADYSKVNANLDSLSADLTPAKNAAASAFNEGNQQIRDGSTSLQSYMTRRMGSSAQQAEVLSQIAAKEREMKNAIHQTKAGVGAQIAVDDANRKYQNRVDSLMNKAAKEAFVQRLGDNMLGMAKAMDEKEIANLTIEEGNKYMKAIGDRYEVFSDDSGKITGYRLKYK